MRTTLTLDDDVAAQLEQLRERGDAPFKDIVNEALRRGLRDMASKPKSRKPFRTKGLDIVLLVDDPKEALRLMDEEYDRKKLGL